MRALLFYDFNGSCECKCSGMWVLRIKFKCFVLLRDSIADYMNCTFSMPKLHLLFLILPYQSYIISCQFSLDRERITQINKLYRSKLTWQTLFCHIRYFQLIFCSGDLIIQGYENIRPMLRPATYIIIFIKSVNQFRRSSIKILCHGMIYQDMLTKTTMQ